jgi:CBS domain-containing protein
MSPRAAWRLESLGFRKVYDYVAGKVDWLAGGLPVEGKLAAFPRAVNAVRKDVPTCRLTDRVGDVADRLRESGHRVCVVTNERGIMFGRLLARALNADPETAVEEVMEPGPTAIRPDDPLEGLVERMRKAGVRSILVTTPEGRLVGIVYREDAERFLAERAKRDDQ